MKRLGPGLGEQPGIVPGRAGEPARRRFDSNQAGRIFFDRHDSGRRDPSPNDGAEIANENRGCGASWPLRGGRKAGGASPGRPKAASPTVRKRVRGEVARFGRIRARGRRARRRLFRIERRCSQRRRPRGLEDQLELSVPNAPVGKNRPRLFRPPAEKIRPVKRFPVGERDPEKREDRRGDIDESGRALPFFRRQLSRDNGQSTGSGRAARTIIPPWFAKPLRSRRYSPWSAVTIISVSSNRPHFFKRGDEPADFPVGDTGARRRRGRRDIFYRPPYVRAFGSRTTPVE